MEIIIYNGLNPVSVLNAISSASWLLATLKTYCICLARQLPAGLPYCDRKKMQYFLRAPRKVDKK